MVAQSVAHVSHGLIEHARDLVQTGQVVFVIFHAAEGRIEGQRRVSEVNAAKLRGRHLPVFELRAVERLAQAAQHQRVVEFFLLRESGDVDGLETRQRLASVFEIVGNRLVGKIAQPVVVAIVANLGGEFRLSAQRVLPLIGEQTIEFGSPRFERLLSSLGKERDDESQGERRQSRAMFARGRPPQRYPQ